MQRNPGRPPGTHPATCEREYSAAEREFLAACERYRAARHKPFLFAADYLRVLLQLGYTKPPGLAGSRPAGESGG